jgi:NDP-mannose synthase
MSFKKEQYMNDTAVILAGGKGTRLWPYTAVLPKPLVPVGERAVLEILIGRLKACGVTKLFICVNHFAELIRTFFGDGSKYGVSIEYSLEDMPLSTVAPVKLIKTLPNHFLVMNGDLLTDMDFRDLMRIHLEHKALLSVATFCRSIKIDFGVIDVDHRKQFAKGFQEKPTYNFEVSMGVYAFDRRILDLVPENRPYGFDELMRDMLSAHKNVSIFRYNGFWLDIGRPEDYDKANEEIKKVSLL